MTNLNIPHLRSQARALARSGDMTYRAALDHLARRLNFKHWNDLRDSQVNSSSRPAALPITRLPATATRSKVAGRGRRFTRYYQDAKFRTAVDQEFAYADAEARKGGWITYGIQDPTRPDPSGQNEFQFVYVGQTKEFGKRVRKRMRDAGTAVRRPITHIDGALYDIMARGAVPRFRVLDRVTDAVASFVSETNWAKRLTTAGHPLLNKWTEQKFGGLAIDRSTVPHKWLWRLCVEDALEARIELVMVNKDSGQDMVIDLNLWEPKTLLRDVKARSMEHALHLGHVVTIRLYVR